MVSEPTTRPLHPHPFAASLCDDPLHTGGPQCYTCRTPNPTFWRVLLKRDSAAVAFYQRVREPPYLTGPEVAVPTVPDKDPEPMPP